MSRFDDWMAAEKEACSHQPKHHRDEEHRLQTACVRWFSLQYPKYKGRLFAVPNGALRDRSTAVKLKAEGVTPGVSDLIFLKSNRFYAALLIEMKTPSGRQSEVQRKWEQQVTADGEYQYVVCRSLEQFMSIIKDYLENGNKS